MIGPRPGIKIFLLLQGDGRLPSLLLIDYFFGLLMLMLYVLFVLFVDFVAFQVFHLEACSVADSFAHLIIVLINPNGFFLKLNCSLLHGH